MMNVRIVMAASYSTAKEAHHHGHRYRSWPHRAGRNKSLDHLVGTQSNADGMSKPILARQEKGGCPLPPARTPDVAFPSQPPGGGAESQLVQRRQVCHRQASTQVDPTSRPKK